MKRSLERLVRERARSRCEYCQVAQECEPTPFQVDHVVAESHGGPTIAANLALACFLDNSYLDNSYKGPNLAGIDPKTQRTVQLFNPKRQRWARHFRRNRPVLVGLTAAGRAAGTTLRINLPHRVAQRAALIAEGVSPPG
jgi:hypothetical protein